MTIVDDEQVRIEIPAGTVSGAEGADDNVVTIRFDIVNTSDGSASVFDPNLRLTVDINTLDITAVRGEDYGPFTEIDADGLPSAPPNCQDEDDGSFPALSICMLDPEQNMIRIELLYQSDRRSEVTLFILDEEGAPLVEGVEEFEVVVANPLSRNAPEVTSRVTILPEMLQVPIEDTDTTTVTFDIRQGSREADRIVTSTTLAEDDPSIATARGTVEENVDDLPPITIDIFLTNPVAEDLTVQIITAQIDSDETATVDEDFDLVEEEVIFRNTETAVQTVQFSILDDQVVENDNEEFALIMELIESLNSEIFDADIQSRIFFNVAPQVIMTSGTPVHTISSTFTITDDELIDLVVVLNQPELTIIEGNTITVSISLVDTLTLAGTPNPVMVEVAIGTQARQAAMAPAQQLQINVDSRTQTLVFLIPDDSAIELARRFDLVVTSIPPERGTARPIDARLLCPDLTDIDPNIDCASDAENQNLALNDPQRLTDNEIRLTVTIIDNDDVTLDLIVNNVIATEETRIEVTEETLPIEAIVVTVSLSFTGEFLRNVCTRVSTGSVPRSEHNAVLGRDYRFGTEDNIEFVDVNFLRTGTASTTPREIDIMVGTTSPVTSPDITINIIDDGDVEATEDFRVILSRTDCTTGQVAFIQSITVEIMETDPADMLTVGFDSDQYAATEDNTTLSITIILTPEGRISSQDVMLQVSTHQNLDDHILDATAAMGAGGDYFMLDSNGADLTPPGDPEETTTFTSIFILEADTSQQIIQIRIVNDTIIEDPEIFEVRLALVEVGDVRDPRIGMEMGRTRAIVTITDNDRAIISFIMPDPDNAEIMGDIINVMEGNSIDVSVQADLDNNQIAEVGNCPDEEITSVCFGTSINISRTADPEDIDATAEDYSLEVVNSSMSPNSIILSGTTLMRTLRIMIEDDELTEGTEKFELRLLGTSTNANSGTITSITFTIIDNDSIKIGFNPVVYTLPEQEPDTPLPDDSSVTCTPTGCSINVVVAITDGTLAPEVQVTVNLSTEEITNAEDSATQASDDPLNIRPDFEPIVNMSVTITAANPSMAVPINTIDETARGVTPEVEGNERFQVVLSRSDLICAQPQSPDSCTTSGLMVTLGNTGEEPTTPQSASATVTISEGDMVTVTMTVDVPDPADLTEQERLTQAGCIADVMMNCVLENATDEVNRRVTITLDLTGTLARTSVTVMVSTREDTDPDTDNAEPGTDYQFVDAADNFNVMLDEERNPTNVVPMTFTQTVTTQTVILQVQEDDFLEMSEYFVIILSSDNSLVMLADAEATVIILDSQNMLMWTVFSEENSVEEGNEMQYTILYMNANPDQAVPGQTFSILVEHVLQDTQLADYAQTLPETLNIATQEVSGVSVTDAVRADESQPGTATVSGPGPGTSGPTSSVRVRFFRPAASIPAPTSITFSLRLLEDSNFEQRERFMIRIREARVTAQDDLPTFSDRILICNPELTDCSQDGVSEVQNNTGQDDTSLLEEVMKLTTPVLLRTSVPTMATAVTRQVNQVLLSRITQLPEVSPQGFNINFVSLVGGSEPQIGRPLPLEQRLRWNTWATGTFNNVNSEQDVAVEGTVINVWTGTDYLIDQNILVGVLVGYENSNLEVNELEQNSVEGQGYAGGIYMGAQVLPGVIMDVSFAWMSISYDTEVFDTRLQAQDDEPIGNVSASFDARRLMFAGNLTGTWHWNSLRISPQLGVMWANEAQDAYQDSNNITVDKQDFNFGRIVFGPELGIRMNMTANSWIEPFGAATGQYDFMTDIPQATILREESGTDTEQTEQEVRALDPDGQLELQARGGLMGGIGRSFTYRFEGTYDGLLDQSGYTAWSGSATLGYRWKDFLQLSFTNDYTGQDAWASSTIVTYQWHDFLELSVANTYGIAYAWSGSTDMRYQMRDDLALRVSSQYNLKTLTPVNIYIDWTF